mmetsp:Transcript_48364/g.111993  ORF Transcript_48364/g.111993 Transcript_48364/m.111993 type:complete len:203 (+) Transcript_48364:859-1467(+)
MNSRPHNSFRICTRVSMSAGPLTIAFKRVSTQRCVGFRGSRNFSTRSLNLASPSSEFAMASSSRQLRTMVCPSDASPSDETATAQSTLTHAETKGSRSQRRSEPPPATNDLQMARCFTIALIPSGLRCSALTQRIEVSIRCQSSSERSLKRHRSVSSLPRPSSPPLSTNCFSQPNSAEDITTASCCNCSSDGWFSWSESISV